MKAQWFTQGRPIRKVVQGALVLAALVLAPVSGFAQADREEPRSFSLRGDKQLAEAQLKTLPRVDAKLLLAQDQSRRKNLQAPEPLRFALANDVAWTLKNSGTWQTLADGRLWRLRIASPGAVSHNLGLTRFDMPAGAQLWVYDPKHTRVEGPYSASHKSGRNSLWTPLIPGDEIVVEVFVPKGVALPQLEIGKANQGYRGFHGLDKDIPGGGTAGTCENDVICPVGAPWAAEIRSVAVYSIGGTGFCTGTMLNNPAPRKQYFLSANHCGVTAANDNTVVTYWNYESPVCGDQGPDNVYDTQLSSTFKARHAPSDFLLLELENSPPANIYYSGWDSTSSAAPMTVAIHHPRADVKSISFSNSATVSTSYNNPAPNPAGNHWMAAWDDGVTEPGSSGSCLWDAVTRRCIGQLHGGPSFCGGPELWDFYGKFSVSWDGGGTSATRLRDWLDPANVGNVAMDGDPHITNLDGIHYDFQGAGEYVGLRDAGAEIQARMVPISTTFTPGADPYDGLATCVSLISAVATNVDGHRVTIQPNLSGVPDPSGLQVRVDGVLTALGTSPLGVGAGRIARSSVGNGYEIHFPNGTAAYVTPLYWGSQGKWYMNVDVFRKPGSGGYDGRESSGGGASDLGGLMAPLAPGSWLPAMPDGSSLGSMPGTLNQRYVDLYQKFGNAWRVGSGSLFDYKPGTSTATFTYTSWPPEKPPCIIPETPVAKPLPRETAVSLCAAVKDRKLNENCVFDVTVTGEPGFATLYLHTQKLRAGATTTTLFDPKNPTRADDPVTFLAVVTARALAKTPPTGTVQFFVDGEKAGQPAEVDASGQAKLEIPKLGSGEYKVTASYTPKEGSVFLASSSSEEVHSVDRK